MAKNFYIYDLDGNVLKNSLCYQNYFDFIKLIFEYRFKNDELFFDVFFSSEKLLNFLPSNYRNVVFNYFGFDGKKFTFKEIGNFMGLSSSHISFLNNKAIKKIVYSIDKDNVLLDDNHFFISKNVLLNNQFLTEKERDFLIHLSDDKIYDNLDYIKSLILILNERIKYKKYNISSYNLSLEDKLKDEKYDEILINELGFSLRCVNSLLNFKINTLEDLLNLNIYDLKNIPKIGKKCVEDILFVLEKNNLKCKNRNLERVKLLNNLSNLLKENCNLSNDLVFFDDKLNKEKVKVKCKNTNEF